MVRYWFLVHRYLGLSSALIMLLWTLSGIVMMYKPYPRLSDIDALQWQQPLELQHCCRLPKGPTVDGELQNLRVDMQLHQPVLRFVNNDEHYAYSLQTGERLSSISPRQAASIMQPLLQSHWQSPVSIQDVERIDHDQWTIYGAYNRHRPLYRLLLDDTASTQPYISSRTGEVVQITTADSRLWGYLGAVIHWIYPTALRQYVGVWSQLVTWLSVLGTFLTITGLYVGVRQLKRRHSGRLSPYKGWAAYHHYCGLIFGVVTLTWIVSGLLSMNPAGVLDMGSSNEEEKNLRGNGIHWQQLSQLLSELSELKLSVDTVRLQWVSSGHQIGLIAYDTDGQRQRFDANMLSASPLTLADLQQRVLKMLPQQSVASQGLLLQGDSFHYAHHKPVELPIYRAVTDTSIHYYLSPVSGELVRKADKPAQWYRWLFQGLHQGDFTSWMRSRPLWDVFMIILLIGVSLLCGSGCYMAVKRLQLIKRRREKKKLVCSLKKSAS